MDSKAPAGGGADKTRCNMWRRHIIGDTVTVRVQNGPKLEVMQLPKVLGLLNDVGAVFAAGKLIAGGVPRKFSRETYSYAACGRGCHDCSRPTTRW